VHQHGIDHPSGNNIRLKIRIKIHCFYISCYRNYLCSVLEFTTHKIIWLLDVREYTTSYTNHPKELIDIITWVANKPCKGNSRFKGLENGSRYWIFYNCIKNQPPKTTRTYLASNEWKISQAAFSGDDIAVPTVAM
jgi:hypothetical protein